VSVWGGKFREEVIVNVTVLLCGSGERLHREEMILNISVFFVRVWGGQ